MFFKSLDEGNPEKENEYRKTGIEREFAHTDPFREFSRALLLLTLISHLNLLDGAASQGAPVRACIANRAFTRLPRPERTTVLSSAPAAREAPITSLSRHSENPSCRPVPRST
jgi:hypothetical protein